MLRSKCYDHPVWLDRLVAMGLGAAAATYLTRKKTTSTTMSELPEVSALKQEVGYLRSLISHLLVVPESPKTAEERPTRHVDGDLAWMEGYETAADQMYREELSRYLTPNPFDHRSESEQS